MDFVHYLNLLTFGIFWLLRWRFDRQVSHGVYSDHGDNHAFVYEGYNRGTNSLKTLNFRKSDLLIYFLIRTLGHGCSHGSLPPFTSVILCSTQMCKICSISWFIWRWCAVCGWYGCSMSLRWSCVCSLPSKSLGWRLINGTTSGWSRSCSLIRKQANDGEIFVIFWWLERKFFRWNKYWDVLAYNSSFYWFFKFFYHANLI